MKVFLGFAYRDADKDLAGYCDQLLASQFAQTVTGEKLGGDALTPAVQQRIEACAALVGLLTQRDLKANGTYTTHQWVIDEIAYARAKGKRAIAMVETGVDIGGMYQAHEFIQLDRANPLPAFLKLSETVGEWKRALGRTIKVQILPQLLARKVGSGEARIRCSHRLWSKGKTSQWTSVTPVPEGGGTFAWVEGVGDDDLIQLRIEGVGRQPWQSVATSQWMQVQLAEEKRR
jgi:hypothetical protein